MRIPLLFVAALACGGCATQATITVSGDTCRATVSGLYLAHGFSTPVAELCKDPRAQTEAADLAAVRRAQAEADLAAVKRVRVGGQ